MLKIRRVHLSGFKSFVDPTTVEFAGGLTAIVGPNGCGKSNIADAVIWGLGERSAKSLRGGTMEDVIFAGSEGRKALGMAEVTLEMAADPSFPAAEDGRLEVGRRVFRSGESRYMMNGKTVRLKDVRSLVMDTGLGLRGYSMIEQGQIGMILSSKPQERRKLLEEAAGITRYKDRRRVAVVKLEEANANLARLDDVLSEVQRAMRSLKRQANAAKRYRDAQNRRADLLRSVLLGRWARVYSALADLRAKIDVRVDREAELTAELHRLEARLAEGREKEQRSTRELAEQHREDTELAARIEGKQEFLKGARQRHQEVRERLASGHRDGEGQGARRRGLVGEVAALQDVEAELVEELGVAATELSDDEGLISGIVELVNEAEARRESTRASLLTSLSAVNDLRNRLHREQVEREKGDLRLSHLASSLEGNEEEAATNEESRAQVRRQLGSLTEKADEHRRTLAAARERSVELGADSERLEALRVSLKDELVALEQRRQVIARLAAARRERLKTLTAALAEAGLSRVTLLSERLEVPEGWAESLDLFLGELSEAAILSDDEDALRLARFLLDRRSGAHLIRSRPADDDETLSDPSIIATVGEALGLGADLAAALPPAYLVETAADAERLARSHPGASFLSREGLAAQAGVLRVTGDSGRPGVLASEQELADLDRRIPPLGERLAATVTDLDRIVDESRQVAELIGPEEEALAGLGREIAVAEARLEDLGLRARRLGVERENLESESAQTRRDLESLGERQQLLEAEFVASEKRHAELEEAFDQRQLEAIEARQRREESTTAGASRRGRHQLIEQRLASHRSEVGRLTGQIADIDGRLEAWEEEKSNLDQRQAEIEQAIAQAETELQTALEARATSQESLLAAQSALDTRRHELQALEKRLAGLREDRDGVRAELADLRVERATHAQDAEHLESEFRREFDQDLPEAPETASENLPEIEVEYERCEALLERLGPVNLLAAEEHEEQTARNEFLTTQRADVASSVKKLHATIDELNRESTVRFQKTFDEVNESFAITFQELFRGGRASMRLIDEDDPLDSGIEIMARPPGKRLQNLMLLSGGEKALTAIALLFGLFRTKPSPFCILDEVDAPLDDVNTVRFIQLVKKMTADTQFVLITHNKITMEAASRLYGVTMQERGVSQLVAVELDEVQPRERQLATA